MQQLIKEIIVDNFAGGGGASTGIELAIGRSVDIAINHDPAAIAMHKMNHPDSEHLCQSVWDIDPREVVRGRPVALCWFSPDCKHFSKAKGGKPVEKSIRGLAWVAVRWAAIAKPRVIILENVEEFKTWGPIKDGQPDPKRKGLTFRTFVNALKRQGYEVDWRELRACDYGAPTIRKRFFLIARRDGRPITWPQPTHGAKDSIGVKSGELLPWRTAAEIIDWTIPCPSIFERSKPLAENTLRRIARGLQKFVIDNPNPFIVKVNHSGAEFRGQPIDEPLQTMTAKNGYGIVTPYIARIGQTGFGGDRMQYPIEDPLTTIVTKAEHLLISPTLIQTGYGEREGQSPRILDLEKPLGTVVAGGTKHAVVAASLVKHYGGGYDGPGNDVNDPLSTITTVDHNALVSALLVQYNTETTENGMRGQSLDDPINTIPTANRYGLVTSSLMILRNNQFGQEVTQPIPTVTAGGGHVAEVRAFLIAYYGSSIGQDINEPLQTVVTKDRFGLVTIKGVDYQIVDIGMRMLEPHELFAAQGFPKEYIIDRDSEGNKIPKSAQVARCGNSVPPPFAQALVRANLPEQCTELPYQSRHQLEMQLV
ncbi:MAG: (cytosine-5-)-methyltransferase [Bacilli bacterium]|nr:(cytosine-5-)-methyltransferase [Bacilli bacterium]